MSNQINLEFQKSCENYFKKGHKQWSSYFDKWESAAASETVEDGDIAELSDCFEEVEISPVAKKRKVQAAETSRKKKKKEFIEKTQITFEINCQEEEGVLDYLSQLSKQFTTGNPFFVDSKNVSVNYSFDKACENFKESSNNEQVLNNDDYFMESSPNSSRKRHSTNYTFSPLTDSFHMASPTRYSTVHFSPEVKSFSSYRYLLDKPSGYPEPAIPFSSRPICSPIIFNSTYVPFSPKSSPGRLLALPAPGDSPGTVGPQYDVCVIDSDDEMDTKKKQKQKKGRVSHLGSNQIEVDESSDSEGIFD